jgi:hypothetical protein
MQDLVPGAATSRNSRTDLEAGDFKKLSVSLSPSLEYGEKTGILKGFEMVGSGS